MLAPASSVLEMKTGRSQSIIAKLVWKFLSTNLYLVQDCFPMFVAFFIP